MAARDPSSGAWIDDLIGSEVKLLDLEPLMPARLGSWRVQSLLGEGGQGKVYRAQRECDGVTQTAAVKVLARPITADAVLARFQRERTILAGLDHPNVARFLVAERTASGRPLLVMDYVEGRPIDVYCDQESLGLDERLTLFATVARAVHAVHRHEVIHRDIKPSNLLVTRDGTPKLLDFGVAKLTGTSEATATLTTTSLAPFTPDYASPEQILGDPITTSVDVYALGVLLYRLLTGQVPYRRHGRTPREYGRSIQRNEPVLPSVRITGAAATEQAGAQFTSRDLRGDLDTIVARAMHGDPQRRYDSAMALADDVQRHLEGRPVLARPDTVGYRLGKVARRHRWAVSTLAVVTAAVVALVVFYTHRFRNERDRSDAFRDAFHVLMRSADPNVRAQPGEGTPESEEAPSIETPAQQIQRLDAMAQSWDGENDPDPGVQSMIAAARRAVDGLDEYADVQAGLLETLAQVLRNFRRHSDAVDLLERSLSIRRSLVLPGPLGTVLHDLGVVHMEMDDLVAAKRCLIESERLRIKAHGERSQPVAETRQQLAELDWARGHLEAARERIEVVLELRRQALPKDALGLAGALDVWGAVQSNLGDIEGAVGAFREALRVRRAELGDVHTQVAENWNNLSFVLRELGKQTSQETHFAAAADALREALAIHATVLGPVTMDSAIVLLNLGIVQHYQERPEESLSSCQSALDLVRKIGSGRHVNLSKALQCLGRAHLALNDFAAAEIAYREAVEVVRLRVQVDDGRRNELATPLRRLGLLLMQLDRPAEAVPLLRESDAIRPSNGAVCGLVDALRATDQVSEAMSYEARCTT